jgi:hypothetical protein
MQQPLDSARIEKRALRETAIDGLLELFIGVWLFYTSGAVNGSPRAFAFMPLVFFVCAAAMWAIKTRYVHPRLGYAQLPEGKTQVAGRIILYFLGAGLIALVAILIATGDLAHPAHWYNKIPIFIGIFLGGAIYALSAYSGLMRFRIYTVLCILSAIPFMIIPFTGKLEAVGMYLLALAGFFIVAGLVTFTLFLRRYPIIAEGAVDEK